ncbi:unknown protein [Simkania negevensis Z]|uniref:Uncharacterized protein n=1 Tax=Simkania negevensis (strain ATCC VR-1471 / DSM 27360 / Z) TaxID=331113 RepID=F8L8S5_SIMNZ|nr:unknown protein [Simkania negevensis Z]
MIFFTDEALSIFTELKKSENRSSKFIFIQQYVIQKFLKKLQ